MPGLIVILMGSMSDEPHGRRIAEAARSLMLDVDIRVGSAHKAPGHVLDLLREYEADPRPKVYVTVAGLSNALSGLVDGAVSAPVIACPPPGDAFSGMDVLSSLRMPAGIAPAVVLEPANAALCAAKILGLGDAAIRAAVAEHQRRNRSQVEEADRSLHPRIP
jgi:phosphoribosylaminoimidazole carboxylase PurE protein